MSVIPIHLPFGENLKTLIQYLSFHGSCPPLAFCHRESENYFGKDVLGTVAISPLARGESENYLGSSEWRLGYDARLLICHTFTDPKISNMIGYYDIG